MTDKTRYKHLVTELGNEHPPLIDRDEMLCSSLNSKYCFDAVKDVIIEACLYQRDADIAWYEAAKTASIKEQAVAFETGKMEGRIECQQRVERIKREIEKKDIDTNTHSFDYTYIRIHRKDWDDIWKFEEIGEEEEVLMPYSDSIERKT